jgi:thiol-disulfide isomerase/thioredoxin
MKTLKSIFSILVFSLLVTVSAFGQSAPKVIAVINKADWCSVCKANGDRAMAAFTKNNTDGAIAFVGNNVTDDTSEKKSAEELKKYGLDKVIQKYTGTGVAYFFNPTTKTLLTEISLAEPDNKLAEALTVARNSVK